MIVIWRETADDEVRPPNGMAVASSTVRRRSWECQVEHRRIELTAYLGIDVLSAVVIRWDCQVWEHGFVMDRMSSGTRWWAGLPTGANSVELALDGLTPAAVRRYAVWGELLSATVHR